MGQSKKLWRNGSRRERIITVALIVVGLLLIGFFSARAIRSFLRIQLTGLDPGATDVELIRGWMTIPYIANAYDVPEEYLFEQINIPQEGNRDKSLRQLNQEYAEGQQAVLLGVVQEAIKQYQRDNPRPPEPDRD